MKQYFPSYIAPGKNELNIPQRHSTGQHDLLKEDLPSREKRDMRSGEEKCNSADRDKRFEGECEQSAEEGG